jgi:hypothetical protein
LDQVISELTGVFGRALPSRAADLSEERFWEEICDRASD